MLILIFHFCSRFSKAIILKSTSFLTSLSPPFRHLFPHSLLLSPFPLSPTPSPDICDEMNENFLCPFYRAPSAGWRRNNDFGFRSYQIKAKLSDALFCPLLSPVSVSLSLVGSLQDVRLPRYLKHKWKCESFGEKETTLQILNSASMWLHRLKACVQRN